MNGYQIIYMLGCIKVHWVWRDLQIVFCRILDNLFLVYNVRHIMSTILSRFRWSIYNNTICSRKYLLKSFVKWSIIYFEVGLRMTSYGGLLFTSLNWFWYWFFSKHGRVISSYPYCQYKVQLKHHYRMRIKYNPYINSSI